jgi:hypothetical protein
VNLVQKRITIKRNCWMKCFATCSIMWLPLLRIYPFLKVRMFICFIWKMIKSFKSYHNIFIISSFFWLPTWMMYKCVAIYNFNIFCYFWYFFKKSLNLWKHNWIFLWVRFFAQIFLGNTHINHFTQKWRWFFNHNWIVDMISMVKMTFNSCHLMVDITFNHHPMMVWYWTTIWGSCKHLSKNKIRVGKSTRVKPCGLLDVNKEIDLSF